MDSNLCLNHYSIYVTHLLNFTNPMPIGQLFNFIHHIYHKISSVRIQNEDKSQYYAIFEDYLKADFTRKDGKYFATGGGACKLCGKVGTNSGTCPFNPKAVASGRVKPEKHNDTPLPTAKKQKETKTTKKSKKKTEEDNSRPKPEPEPVVVPVIEPEEESNIEDENKIYIQKLQEQILYFHKCLEIINLLDDASIIVLKEQYTNFYNIHLKNVDLNSSKLKEEYDKYDKSVFSENKNLELVFEIICRTQVEIDNTSVYLKNNESTDKYSNVYVGFPPELFGLPVDKSRNIQQYSFILMAISSILDDTEYPLGSGNTIYSQTNNLLTIRASMKRMNLGSYVMPNRKEFIDFMKNTFNPAFRKTNQAYTKIWIDSSGEDDGAYETRQLFQQQRFASEYLNDNTPYRGELLYHGLGSGKSGASIATSEGFNNRQIVVMPPASLRANYEIEIEKWANVGYRRTHKWCFVPLDIKWKKGQDIPLSTNEPVIQMLVEKGIPRELLDHRIKNNATRSEKRQMNSVKCPNPTSILRIRKNKTRIKYANGKERNKTYNYGIWLIDPTANEPNYDSLSEEDKLQVNDTIKKMIQHRYRIISYNSGAILFTHSQFGIFSLYPKELMDKILQKALGMLKEPSKLTNKDKGSILDVIYNPENGFPNPFDNKAIVIDEVHNIISQMIGSGYNGANLYEMLLRAKNCKIIALSGTPVINTPVEMFVLFNILRGLEISFEFKVYNNLGTPIRKNNKPFLSVLHSIPEMDRIISNIDGTYTVSRLPHHFVREYEMESGKKSWNGKVRRIEGENEYYSMVKTAEENVNYTDNEHFVKNADVENNVFVDYLIKCLSTVGFTLRKKEVHVHYHTSFPNFLLKSTQEYTEDQASLGEYRMLRKANKQQIKNMEKDRQHLESTFIDGSKVREDYSFLTRILGLVSYYCETVANVPERTYEYENETKVLSKIPAFPQVKLNDPIEVQLSEYQLYEYTDKRMMEIEKEKMSKKMSKVNDPTKKTSQVFKVFTRQVSRFAFPPKLPRPRIEYSKLKDPKEKKKREGEEKEGDENNEGNKVNNSEGDIELMQDALGDDDLRDEIDGTSSKKAQMDKMKKEYEKKILKTLEKLKPRFLIPRQEGDDDFANPTLTELSPLYIELLKRVNASPGLVFGYSQFRKIEGVELFKRILEANGWGNYNEVTSKIRADGDSNVNVEDQLDQLDIEIGMRCIIQLGKNVTITAICSSIETVNGVKKYKFADIEREFNESIQFHLDDWTDMDLFKSQLNRSILEHIQSTEPTKEFPENVKALASYEFNREDLSHARFGLWTGQEDTGERKLIQVGFNALSNKYGRHCRMLMTTSAGSEGISLRHVRQVHIMEPYWNRVRIDQVIGRARRVYSHLELVAEQQNVQVFEYITKFPEKEITALEEDVPELFLDYIKQKMGKTGIKKKEALISFYNTFVTNYNSMIEQDENKTSDETLYLGGQRKYQLNRSFLELTRDGAIDCIINAEENRQAGILREGTKYKEIECASDGKFSGEFDLNQIKQYTDENDKYSFPLVITSEELAVTRKKKQKVVKETVGKARLIPVKRIPNRELYWGFVQNKIWICTDQKNSNRNMNIYNYYRYIGLDPIFNSFNQKQLQFDPAILKNCKIGSYLNRVEGLDEDRDDFKMEQLRFEIGDTYLIYLVKLQNYIQNAWQYLTSKNKVSGPFTTRNEEGLGLLRTLMFMGVKSEFPFTFSHSGKVYGYSAFLKKGKTLDLDNIGQKSPLMSYLMEQVGLMKLQLFKMKKQMKLKKSTRKPQIQKKKTTEELIKIAAKLKVPTRRKERKVGKDVEEKDVEEKEADPVVKKRRRRRGED